MAVTMHPLAERDLSAAARIIRVAFGTFIGVPAMYKGNNGCHQRCEAPSGEPPCCPQEAAVGVTQDLMTIFGGTPPCHARAGIVMGMANDQAYEMVSTIFFKP